MCAPFHVHELAFSQKTSKFRLGVMITKLLRHTKVGKVEAIAVETRVNLGQDLQIRPPVGAVSNHRARAESQNL